MTSFGTLNGVRVTELENTFTLSYDTVYEAITASLFFSVLSISPYANHRFRECSYEREDHKLFPLSLQSAAKP